MAIDDMKRELKTWFTSAEQEGLLTSKSFAANRNKVRIEQNVDKIISELKIMRFNELDKNKINIVDPNVHE